jgi:hypothetical protein
MEVNRRPSTEKRPNPLRAALAMMINPGAVMQKAVGRIPWPFSLSISALAFMLFFLQTGLDLMRIGLKSIGFVVLLSVEGLLFGSLGIALLALIAWGITRLFKGDKPIGWAISAFGLGYCSTLIFTVLGIFFSLFLHWNTSVAFGVSGVLWATGPMVSSIRQMSHENTTLSVIVATICSALLLFGWALLGNA